MHAAPVGVLDVVLDADGRPFDVAMEVGATASREHVTRVAPVEDVIVVVGGERFGYLDGSEQSDGLRVDVEGTTALTLDAVIHRSESGSPSVAGIILHLLDEDVVRWDSFTAGYGTDGGMGVVSTLAASRSSSERRIAFVDRFVNGRQLPLIVGDLDGTPGADVVLFDNGFGDGEFPLTRGRTSDGRVAEVVVWHLTVPWRWVFAGEPPLEVTQRESDLQACLDGTKTIDSQRCRPR